MAQQSHLALTLSMEFCGKDSLTKVFLQISQNPRKSTCARVSQTCNSIKKRL